MEATNSFGEATNSFELWDRDAVGETSLVPLGEDSFLMDSSSFDEGLLFNEEGAEAGAEEEEFLDVEYNLGDSLGLMMHRASRLNLFELNHGSEEGKRRESFQNGFEVLNGKDGLLKRREKGNQKNIQDLIKAQEEAHARKEQIIKEAEEKKKAKEQEQKNDEFEETMRCSEETKTAPSPPTKKHQEGGKEGDWFSNMWVKIMKNDATAI